MRVDINVASLFSCKVGNPKLVPSGWLQEVHLKPPYLHVHELMGPKIAHNLYSDCHQYHIYLSLPMTHKNWLHPN